MESTLVSCFAPNIL
jgi:hypothetical protein